MMKKIIDISVINLNKKTVKTVENYTKKLYNSNINLIGVKTDWKKN